MNFFKRTIFNLNKTLSGDLISKSLPKLIDKFTIQKQHLDLMGHLNVIVFSLKSYLFRHYVGIYDDSAYELLKQLGITKEFIQNNSKGCFMLRHDVHYLKEVHYKENVSTHFRIINISKSKKRVHFYFYLLNQNEVSSFCEGIFAFSNLKERKLEPFPAEILEKLEKLQKNHTELSWKHEPNLKLEL
eukprot:gene2715-3911_t